MAWPLPQPSSTTVTFPTHRDLFYGGRWHAGQVRSLSRRQQSRDRRIARQGRRRRCPGRRRRSRRRPRSVSRVARRAGAGPGARGAQSGGDPARARAGTGAPGSHRRRQSAAGDALRRRHQRRLHGLLRGSGDRDQGQHDPDRRRRPQLHGARAARRHRAHRRIQSSVALRRRQMRRAAGRRQYADHQACGSDTAVVAAHRGTVAGRVSAGRRSTSSPAAAMPVPRWSRIRAWPRSASSAASTAAEP